ncbi:MAG: 4-(cytidine 5'-diphospho)-2-C-methyl-D-erythritol kinase [Gemmatimonadetes bacterium]|nr:4-(cytidine 5'-diphospho)-2-C-methyl-D-erythritol kinase [Gemmatimonadota bacterium]
MRVFRAPAKINTRLRILAREASGWHQIESIVCRLDLADEITVDIDARELSLETTGEAVGPAHENLARRAAAAFFAALREPAAARIQLTKRIPAGAGLGGGSSDAATTLIALNMLRDHPLSPDALLRIGASIGSDVPFFLSGASCALVWGRGERVLPLAAPPAVRVVLVVPSRRISTATAYARWAAHNAAETGAAPAVLNGLMRASWDDLADVAGNDFESVADAMVPTLPTIRSVLRAAGARIVQLTGSGSAIFGVFDDATAARTAVRSDSLEILDARVMETRTEGADR